MAEKETWAFYYLQGEYGEDHAHPNAFKITHQTNEQICFSHFLKCFPIGLHGLFHCRFRVNAPKGFLWLDVTKKETKLPLLNGKIIAKILRLDKPIPRGICLKRKAKRIVSTASEQTVETKSASGVSRHKNGDPALFSAPKSSSEKSSDNSENPKQATSRAPPYTDTPSTNEKLKGDKLNVKQQAPPSASQESLDDFLSGGSKSITDKQKSSKGDLLSWQHSSPPDLLDPLGGSKATKKPSVKSSSTDESKSKGRPRSPAQVSRPPAATQDGGQTVGPVTRAEMEAVGCGTFDGTAVWNPNNIDLSTKSAAVAQAIQERLAEKQARQEAAVNELKDREIQQKKLDGEKEAVKQRLDPVLKTWAYDGGKLKNIRALLSSLHTVMWKDSKWTEVGMAKLLSAGDLKKNYRKAVLVVHPDKAAGRTPEQLFIAERVFDALNGSYEQFESQEK